MKEGDHTIYRVQHQDSRGKWTDSALDHFLFGNMSFEDKRGPKGQDYRALLDPERAGWRVTGISGFLSRKDAESALYAVRHEHPDREFQLVRIRYHKHTKVLSTKGRHQ